jgi:hypothetical protein
MMKTLENRFEILETLIIALAKQGEERRKVILLKKEAATCMIGMNYYWGSWSGVIEKCLDPTYVIANIVNQHTGERNHWKLDAENVAKHMEKIKAFSDWKSYWKFELIDAAQNHESMIRGFNWTSERIEVEMKDFCVNFEIPYQDSFLNEVQKIAFKM